MGGEPRKKEAKLTFIGGAWHPRVTPCGLLWWINTVSFSLTPPPPFSFFFVVDNCQFRSPRLCRHRRHKGVNGGDFCAADRWGLSRYHHLEELRGAERLLGLGFSRVFPWNWSGCWIWDRGDQGHENTIMNNNHAKTTMNIIDQKQLLLFLSMFTIETKICPLTHRILHTKFIHKSIKQDVYDFDLS